MNQILYAGATQFAKQQFKLTGRKLYRNLQFVHLTFRALTFAVQCDFCKFRSVRLLLPGLLSQAPLPSHGSVSPLS